MWRRQVHKKRIPKKQRSNPRLVELAKRQYKVQLPDCIKCILKAQNPQQIEEAYKELKSVILKPWDLERKAKSKRYKDFWNDTLDGMVKARKRLYQQALVTGLNKTKAAYEKLDKLTKNYVKRNEQYQGE